MNALPVGTRLGEFELTRTLGDGGFGIVYLAWDHSLERSVALKEYMPSSIAARQDGTGIKPLSARHQDTFDAGMRSFINEAKLLARFDHPALVKVYRFWEANGTAYMVMPFYEGTTLRDTVRAQGVPPDEAWLLALLAPLLDALAVLHANQCYHRDIAPDNVILLADVQNAGVRPLLLDFGAARRVIGETTQALTAILKPGYAPVEQYAEVPGLKQGGWTDVYALAAVVHWAITGKTPPNSVSRMFSDSYQPLAEAAAGRYSAGFLAAIDHALAVLPDDRTQSVGALRIELGLDNDDAERTVAAPPAAWADPDATVLHPSSRTAPTSRAAGATAPRPVVPTLPPVTAPAAADVGRRDADDDGDDHATIVATASLPPVREEPARASAGAAKRGFPVVPVAAAVLVGGVALWWALRETPTAAPPSAAPSADAQPAARSSAAAEPATAGASASARGDGAVSGASPAAQQTPLAAASDVAQRPSPASAPASAPASTAESAPVRTDTATPARGAIPAAPLARARPEPSSRAAAASRPAVTAAKADGRDGTAGVGNRAECARILQQLSLGDSSPELFARGRALNCR